MGDERFFGHFRKFSSRASPARRGFILTLVAALTIVVPLSGCRVPHWTARDSSSGSTGGKLGDGGGGGTVVTAPTVSANYSSGRSKFVRSEPVSAAISSCTGVGKMLVTSSSTAPSNPDLPNAPSCAMSYTLTDSFPDGSDRKSTRLNSSHVSESRMPSSA